MSLTNPHESRLKSLGNKGKKIKREEEGEKKSPISDTKSRE